MKIQFGKEIVDHYGYHFKNKGDIREYSKLFPSPNSYIHICRMIQIGGVGIIINPYDLKDVDGRYASLNVFAEPETWSLGAFVTKDQLAAFMQCKVPLRTFLTQGSTPHAISNSVDDWQEVINPHEVIDFIVRKSREDSPG